MCRARGPLLAGAYPRPRAPHRRDHRFDRLPRRAAVRCDHPTASRVRRRLRPDEARGRPRPRRLRRRRTRRRDPRRAPRRADRPEARRRRRSGGARGGQRRFRARWRPCRARHRPFRAGPLERHDVGRGARVGRGQRRQRAARPGARHGVRARGVRVRRRADVRWRRRHRRHQAGLRRDCARRRRARGDPAGGTRHRRAKSGDRARCAGRSATAPSSAACG